MSLEDTRHDYTVAQRSEVPFVAACYALAACAEYDRICTEQAKEIERLRAAIDAVVEDCCPGLRRDNGQPYYWEVGGVAMDRLCAIYEETHPDSRKGEEEQSDAD